MKRKTGFQHGKILIQAYRDVRNKSHISRDIIPTSRKIGKRTFLEGCFNIILLLACWIGNVQVVSYLLPSYIQYFSIDTLIDKLEVYDFKRAPALYGSKEMACFEDVTSDKVSLLHAAAHGFKLCIIKLLLWAGANVNNPSKWLVSPLISALKQSSTTVNCKESVTCLIESGANVNYSDADGMTPLMYMQLQDLPMMWIWSKY